MKKYVKTEWSIVNICRQHFSSLEQNIKEKLNNEWILDSSGWNVFHDDWYECIVKRHGKLGWQGLPGTTSLVADLSRNELIEHHHYS